MFRGINIVDMYLAGDYPFNEYPDFTTFKKYLDVAKNDFNCDFIRLFLLRDFEQHYPDWTARWTAIEDLIQLHNFTVEYCTYMFWDTTVVDINAYKAWVNKYIGTYASLGMPTNRIWTVNILENSWANYSVSQLMIPYIKSVDPGRTVTTEVWGSPGGMYSGEIIGLPSTKGDPLINNKIYIPSGNLISTADYDGVGFIPTSDLWNQIKSQAPTSPVLMSEFSGNITNRYNIAVQNGAYGVCYWNLHLTDKIATDNEGIPARCPINSDYTLNSIGLELQKAYGGQTAPAAQAGMSSTLVAGLLIGELITMILLLRKK